MPPRPTTESAWMPFDASRGADIVVDDTADATIRWFVKDDAFPRLVLDIKAGQFLHGDGTVPPTAIVSA